MRLCLTSVSNEQEFRRAAVEGTHPQGIASPRKMCGGQPRIPPIRAEERASARGYVVLWVDALMLDFEQIV